MPEPMPPPVPKLSSDPVDVLIVSDAWGTRVLLDACTALSREQFHQQFDIGLGSLHETLTHIVSVMRRWTDRLAERPPRPMLHAVAKLPGIPSDAKDRTPAELRELLDLAEKELLATVTLLRDQDRLASTLVVEWPAEGGVIKRYTFTRGAIIAHVTTHGFHHRAQCLNMLRRLGAPVPGVFESIPGPSVVEWQATIESPGIIKDS